MIILILPLKRIKTASTSILENLTNKIKSKYTKFQSQLIAKRNNSRLSELTLSISHLSHHFLILSFLPTNGNQNYKLLFIGVKNNIWFQSLKNRISLGNSKELTLHLCFLSLHINGL